jgi:uncharacterized membrane protein HdeD (DUF308 family)
MTNVQPTLRDRAVGLVLIALGALVAALPATAAELLPPIGGSVIIGAGAFELVRALAGSSSRRRARRSRVGSALGAIGLVAIGFLVLVSGGLVLAAVTVALGVAFAIDGLRRLTEGWRGLGSPGFLVDLGIGALMLALGAMVAIQWPLEGTVSIGVVLGLRLVVDGWAIVAGRRLGPAGGDEENELVAPSQFPPTPIAAALWERVERSEPRRLAHDRAWMWLFLVVFLAIHVGRMESRWTVVGILSPIGAVAGDVACAVLLGLVLVMPARIALSWLLRPFERRGWRRVGEMPAAAIERRKDQGSRRDRLALWWLERRARADYRLRSALQSPGRTFERGLMGGLPAIAVLVATNPIWGFSWYFNTENWVSGLWEMWAARRVDTWRGAMNDAVDARCSVEGRPAIDRHRVAIEGLDASGDFTFLVIGDPGEGDASQQVLRDRYLEVGARPDVRFLVISSDVIYPAGEMKDYESNFYLQFKGFAKPIVAIPGNHDWYDALDGFVANFFEPEMARAALTARVDADLKLTTTTRSRIDALIERAAFLRDAYGVRTGLQRGTDFEIGNDDFALIAVDTGIDREIDAAQREWLEGALGRAKGKFVMALVGHPLYAGGALQAKEGDFAELRELLERHAVPLVMGGDTHDFEYYLDHANRMLHIVNGGGGAYLSIGSALAPEGFGALADWGNVSLARRARRQARRADAVVEVAHLGVDEAPRRLALDPRDALRGVRLQRGAVLPEFRRGAGRGLATTSGGDPAWRRRSGPLEGHGHARRAARRGRRSRGARRIRGALAVGRLLRRDLRHLDLEPRAQRQRGEHRLEMRAIAHAEDEPAASLVGRDAALDEQAVAAPGAQEVSLGAHEVVEARGVGMAGGRLDPRPRHHEARRPVAEALVALLEARVAHGGVGEEPAQARGVGGEHRGPLVGRGPRRRPRDERLERLEAREPEDAVLDRTHHRVERRVQSEAVVHRLRSAGRHREERPLAAEGAALVPLAAAVHAAHREDLVDPALQDRGQPEPPERELEDERVAALGLLDLAAQVGREAVVRAGVRLLDLLLEVRRVLHRPEVAAVADGIEAHGVEVRHDDVVAFRLQRGDGGGGERAVEALRLMVRVDDEDSHRRSVRRDRSGAGRLKRPPQRLRHRHAASVASDAHVHHERLGGERPVFAAHDVRHAHARVADRFDAGCNGDRVAESERAAEVGFGVHHRREDAGVEAAVDRQAALGEERLERPLHDLEEAGVEEDAGGVGVAEGYAGVEHGSVAGTIRRPPEEDRRPPDGDRSA